MHSIHMASLLQLLMFMALFGLPIAAVGVALAQEKGRNPVLWGVLGLVPWVNVFCLAYFVGAANFRHEQKLDDVIRLLRAK